MTTTPNVYIGGNASSPVQGGVTNSPSLSGVQQQGVSMSQPGLGMRQSVTPSQPTSLSTPVSIDSKVLDKRRLQELVKEVDPMEQLDEDVEEVLMQIADDFIESVVTASCKIAKHRKSSSLDVKDVQLHLERSWGMWVPGFGTNELRPYKKASTTEAHKQRMALIRKTLKKT